jgi:hypothetical protein
MNEVQDRCEIIEKAIVTGNESEVEFFLSQDSGKHSVHPVKGRPSIMVPAENINEVLKKVNCIKMDIEGMEYEMIKAVTDWSKIKLAIIEYHFHYSWLLDHRVEKFNEVMEIMSNNFDRVFVNNRASTHKHFITHFAGFKNV